MRRRALVLLLVVLGACRREPPPPETREQILARTLPAVVLLIARRPDGKLGYGSGVVIDHRGTVLTSLHVVAGAESLSAMLYDPARAAPAPVVPGHEAHVSHGGAGGDVQGAAPTSGIVGRLLHLPRRGPDV